MASAKKRRKQINLARRRQQVATGPFRHPDGDRRHRGGLTYEDGLARKQFLQQFPIVVFQGEPALESAND
jgi:hypothetical protein